MRLLLVWPYAPWPPVTGTSKRLARLTEELLVRAQLGGPEIGVIVTEAQSLTAMPATVPLVAQATRSRGRWRSALAVPGTIIRREPLFVAFYRRRTARAAVARAVRSWDPDLVWVHGVAGMTAVDGIVDDDRLVLDLSDAEPDRFARLSDAVGGWRGRLWHADAARVRRWTSRRLPRLRAVTVVSPADREVYAADAPGARYVLVPNGVDVDPRERVDPGNGTAVFLGDLGYPPNAEGLGWLVRHVLPRTDALVEVLAVGRGSTSRPLGEQTDRVRPLGFVDDLTTVWDSVSVMVVPIHSGGGSRLKVLDAFGAGVPVVSTTFGVSGIDAVADRDYLRADTPEDFAAALDRLLRDASLRGRLAANARELVADRYSWRDCLAPLLGELGLDSQP
jgi:glycosyltransferase involved in cell wall biosynthesis